MREAFLQQGFNDPLRLVVPSLTDSHIADHPSFIDEVHRRPIAVAKAIPIHEIVIHSHDVADSVIPDRCAESFSR